jgi:hypothetical protein
MKLKAFLRDAILTWLGFEVTILTLSGTIQRIVLISTLVAGVLHMLLSIFGDDE